MAKTTSKFVMRKLKTGDIFKMSKILKAMDLDLELPEGSTAQQTGLYLITAIFENLYLAEDDVAELLGDLVGITAEEIKELEIEDTIEIFKLFKEQKGISNFLSLLNK